VVETTFNEKFLRMFHGPGGGFFKKSPLVAEGKEHRAKKLKLAAFYTILAVNKKTKK
jgi:hypothetical protein